MGTGTRRSLEWTAGSTCRGRSNFCGRYHRRARSKRPSRVSTAAFISPPSLLSSAVIASGCAPIEVNLTGTINIFDQARRAAPPRNPRRLRIERGGLRRLRSVPIGEDVRLLRSAPMAPTRRPASFMRGSPARCMGCRPPGCASSTSTARVRTRSPYSGVISIFADRLRRGQPIEIFGDGEQVRDFTYVGDAVAALRRAIDRHSTEAPVLNICTGKGTSVRELAETMASLYRTGLVAYHRPARSGDVRISIGDPRRAAEKLGFTAETALADGLAITLDLPRRRIELKPRVVA